MESYFTVGVKEEDLEAARDPAEEDSALSSRLKTQQEEGKTKMEKLLDEFSRKQIEIKEEPQPVPDDEPVEKPSDDKDEPEELDEDPLPPEDVPQNGEDSNLPGDDENPDGTLADESRDGPDVNGGDQNGDASSSSDSSSEGEDDDNQD